MPRVNAPYESCLIRYLMRHHAILRCRMDTMHVPTRSTDQSIDRRIWSIWPTFRRISIISGDPKLGVVDLRVANLTRTTPAFHEDVQVPILEGTRTLYAKLCCRHLLSHDRVRSDRMLTPFPLPSTPRPYSRCFSTRVVSTMAPTTITGPWIGTTSN